MSKARARLSQLNQGMYIRDNEESCAVEKEKLIKKEHAESVHLPRGQRAEYLKITITMPPELLTSLKSVGMVRKIKGKKDTDVSSLIREVMTDWVKTQQG